MGQRTYRPSDSLLQKMQISYLSAVGGQKTARLVCRDLNSTSSEESLNAKFQWLSKSLKNIMCLKLQPAEKEELPDERRQGLEKQHSMPEPIINICR